MLNPLNEAKCTPVRKPPCNQPCLLGNEEGHGCAIERIREIRNWEEMEGKWGLKREQVLRIRSDRRFTRSLADYRPLSLPIHHGHS